jgi:ABC-type uncharacterized transport system ATPase subunit
MIHLRAICKKSVKERSNSFPFNLPLVKKLQEINLHQPVTFFVGENGSGKSTLLEAIASGVGAIAVGGEDIQTDKSLDPARRLSAQLKFIWNQRTTRGFFLRAEDFFNFARRLNNMTQELEEQASEYEGKFISLKRITFIDECLLELPVVIRRGNVATEVVNFAKSHNADLVVTAESPSPRFVAICDEIEPSIPVEAFAVEPFLHYDGYIDLQRFSRYWKVAERYVFD